MSVNGKVGIVTGAGSGLGEAGAKRLARAGAKLIVADRDQNSAERVVDEIRAGGGDATPEVVDWPIFPWNSACGTLRPGTRVRVYGAKSGSRCWSDQMG